LGEGTAEDAVASVKRVDRQLLIRRCDHLRHPDLKHKIKARPWVESRGCMAAKLGEKGARRRLRPPAGSEQGKRRVNAL
jgi:hypothetical protein